MSGAGQQAGDPFAHYDGAYVLGALSPEERAAYEEHLRGCESCTRAVGELAGLPGLLSLAGPEAADGVRDVAAAMTSEPTPELLPALVARTVALRRRRRLLSALSAGAVALAACLALVFTVASGETGGSEPMTALGEYPVSATVSMADAERGTRVDMECQYGGDRAGDYLLVVIGADGESELLARWQALPDDSASLSVATTLRRADIAALEVRTPSGLVVLRTAF